MSTAVFWLWRPSRSLSSFEALLGLHLQALLQLLAFFLADEKLRLQVGAHGLDLRIFSLQLHRLFFGGIEIARQAFKFSRRDSISPSRVIFSACNVAISRFNAALTKKKQTLG